MSKDNENRYTWEEDEVFVINPEFRLRNEKTHVLFYKKDGAGTLRLHRSYGLVVALCDGERSLRQIANIAIPLAEPQDYETSLNHCRQVITCLRTSPVRLNVSGGNDSISNLPLLKRKEYKDHFVRPCDRFPVYDANDFLFEFDLDMPSKTRESRPLIVQWHLTSECVTDCRYCYLGRRNVHPLPVKRAIELIDEMSTLNVPSLGIAGGDVFRYPHLFDVIEYMSAKSCFFPVALSTKCHIDRDIAKRLNRLQAFISELQFSIDSDDEEIAQYLVGCREYPSRIFQSIDNVVEQGIIVAAKAVITPYNVLTIPRLYRKLKEHGVQAIRLAPYSRSGFHHTDDLFLSEESFSWLEKQVEFLRTEFPDDNISIQNGRPVLNPRSREDRKQVWSKKSICTAGRSAITICTDGKVIPCEQMPETEEYFCGDVTHQSIMEVWDGNRLKEMTYGMPREKFVGQPCFDCEEREQCHNEMGFCIRDLAAHHGNIYQPPPNCFRHDLPFVRQT